jgi:hypothetical protein
MKIKLRIDKDKVSDKPVIELSGKITAFHTTRQSMYIDIAGTKNAELYPEYFDRIEKHKRDTTEYETVKDGDKKGVILEVYPEENREHIRFPRDMKDVCVEIIDEAE